jgi:hypothetical protein
LLKYHIDVLIYNENGKQNVGVRSKNMRYSCSDKNALNTCGIPSNNG